MVEVISITATVIIALLYNIILFSFGFSPENNPYFDDKYEDVSTVDTPICNSPKVKDNESRDIELDPFIRGIAYGYFNKN